MLASGAVSEVAADLLETEEGFSLGSWKNVVIARWSRAVELYEIDQLEKLIRGTAEGASRAHIAIVVSETTTVPSNAGRNRISELMKAVDSMVASWLLVVEGGGFAGAAKRSVATTMKLLSGSRTSMKVFDSTNSLAAWLAPVLGVNLLELRAVVDGVA